MGMFDTVFSNGGAEFQSAKFTSECAYMTYKMKIEHLIRKVIYHE